MVITRILYIYDIIYIRYIIYIIVITRKKLCPFQLELIVRECFSYFTFDTKALKHSSQLTVGSQYGVESFYGQFKACTTTLFWLQQVNTLLTPLSQGPNLTLMITQVRLCTFSDSLAYNCVFTRELSPKWPYFTLRSTADWSLHTWMNLTSATSILLNSSIPHLGKMHSTLY